MINNQLANSCKQGKHKLIEVFRDNQLMYSHVVRWCEDCGAVVGDVESDERINAGGLFKMKFPYFPYPNS